MTAQNSGSPEFAAITISQQVVEKDLNEAILKEWHATISDPEKMKTAGVNAETLPSGSSIVAKQGGGGFGAVETILISVTGGLAKDAAEAIWKSYIWPALKSKFGANVKPSAIKAEPPKADNAGSDDDGPE